MTLVLNGGPFDGRTFDVPDSARSVAGPYLTTDGSMWKATYDAETGAFLELSDEQPNFLAVQHERRMEYLADLYRRAGAA